MNSQIITLKNGLRVIFIDTKAFPTVTTLLLVGAGSRYENKVNNGISHFLEHMFFKGSKKYPTPEIVSSTIEGMGGSWNAFTSKHYTGYFIKAATDHFEKSVDILSDILLNSKFEEKEIAKEKGVVTEEINMYEDQPQSRVGEFFENIMFAGNPLGMDVIGTKETVASISRKTITDYMESLYSPNNVVLVVAGGLDCHSGEKTKSTTPESLLDSGRASLARMTSIIKEKFKNWAQTKSITFKKVEKKQTQPNILVHYKKTEQAHFCLGFPTFGSSDKRKYTLSVLATILGGGASSRLFVEVREKRGLCYYIHTGRELYQDTGYIMTQAGVTKDVVKINEAVKATYNEYQKIISGKISSEEIARAKEMLKGRLLLSLEDSFNVGNFFGMKNLLENNSETPEQVIEKIQKVTIKEVQALAKEIFKSEKLNFAIIGPLTEKDIKKASFD